MGKTKVGAAVPHFNLPATGEQQIDLVSLRGKNVVLYFYPRDNTPGCTSESCDFKKHHLKFRRRNAVVIGISRDSLASHEKFKAKYGLPFDLISDADEKAGKLFDVIKEKNLYGHKHMGIERSTFLIDARGILRCEWRKVKVKGHVEDVLEALRSINT